MTKKLKELWFQFKSYKLKWNRNRDVAVGIHFKLSEMTEEQRIAFFEAHKLLHKAGIGFDSGSGGGEYDWEFDWSLSGPVYITFKNFTDEDPKNRYIRSHYVPFSSSTVDFVQNFAEKEVKKIQTMSCKEQEA